MKNKTLYFTLLAAVLVTSFSPALASADSSGKKQLTKKHVSVEQNNEKLPPGIRNAPGIEKRLENGKGLPKGLLKFLEGTRGGNGFWFNKKATSTSEGVLPKIKDINVNTGTSSATITWNTNESTYTELRYSTGTPVTASSSSSIENIFKTDHKVTLTGLAPDTRYYYVIVAKDQDGDVKTSETLRFRTQDVSEDDNTAPNISLNFVFGVTEDSAKIFWITDEPSDSKIWVSTSTPVVTTGTSTKSETELVRFHEIEVSGLATSTNYYYEISSTDDSGNTKSKTGSFKTE